jgi:hypothetical protein
MKPSATYSNAMKEPMTVQYIAHRSNSGSERGRCERALKVAKDGRRKANQALERGQRRTGNGEGQT